MWRFFVEGGVVVFFWWVLLRHPTNLHSAVSSVFRKEGVCYGKNSGTTVVYDTCGAVFFRLGTFLGARFNFVASLTTVSILPPCQKSVRFHGRDGFRRQPFNASGGVGVVRRDGQI